MSRRTCCGSRAPPDPSGDYRLVPDDNFDEFEAGAFDLVLSAFTFDNIPGRDKGKNLFAISESC